MTALRVAGGGVAVLLAAVTGLVEIFFAGLRIGGWLIGVSVVIALAVNYWLPRYTFAATGARWAAFLPPVAWFALMMAAADRRAEGDLLLAGNWVSLSTIIGGSLAFALGGVRLMASPSRGGPGVPLAG